MRQPTLSYYKNYLENVKALNHFNAKIHHRSLKPEVTPTILELIQI